ncbi:hypothetical protein Taro_020314 [Colocasia esculenta]|uniref:Saposin B-type domain-containing protein n=1 Tax=Colocasia esculenta TaxID=4460 RepID=A0A843V851_COLES|nr:hypothetical protein [Colocasia esculenta]
MTIVSIDGLGSNFIVQGAQLYCSMMDERTSKTYICGCTGASLEVSEKPPPSLKMDMALPFTMAVLLLLLVGVGGVRRDGLVPKGEQPFLRSDDSLHDTTEASLNDLQAPLKEVPPDFFCHSCQEVSRKAEKFLSDPSLYDHANNLSSEVCHVMHSNLQIKCRRLVELYLHEGILFLQIAFSEKNLCNSTGFCPVDDHIKLPSSTSPEHNRRAGFPSIERPSFVLPIGKQLLSKVLSSMQYAPLEAKIKSKTCNTCHTVADLIAKQLEDHDQQVRTTIAI